MKIQITINGKSYPCRPTMGAMLRFKRETGKEVSEMGSNDVSLMCIYLWCCVASASAADGIPFDMSAMDFADCIDPAQMTEWAAQMNKGNVSEDDEKKR